MAKILTHSIGSAGRLTILSREDLERLDAAWDAYFPHHREGGA